MEDELKESIAKYVQEISVEVATRDAFNYITRNLLSIDRLDKNHVVMAGMKFHLSVLEYLHCDSEMVDKMSMIFP